MSKKSRSSTRPAGEDETTINDGVSHDSTEQDDGGPEDAREAQVDGEDETTVNDGVSHAPASEDSTAGAPGPGDIEQSGSLPGQPVLTPNDSNTNASSVPAVGEAQQPITKVLTPSSPPSTEPGTQPGTQPGQEQVKAAYDDGEFAEDRKRARLRQWVINQGLLPVGEVENASDAELEALYQQALGRSGSLPTPELSLSAAQRAQAVLQSHNRQEKLALVSEGGTLTQEQAQSLSDEDLDRQVHAVVVNRLAAEEAKQAAELAALRPVVEEPYGGDAPTYYAVGTGARFMHEGQYVDVKEGAVVNDRSHDIEQLKRMGVKLHQLAGAPDPLAG